MGEKVSRNAEGYPDPTFGGAWGTCAGKKNSEKLNAWQK